MRQIFYRLVASFEYAKTEKDYKRLASMIARARRASVLEEPGTTPYIPFQAIRDDKMRSRGASFYESEDAFIDVIRDSPHGFTIDRQADQPQRIELWCEAGGMLPILADIAEPYGIKVSSSGGYDSVTTKHRLASRVVENFKDDGLKTLLLHVGDFDGSGEDMFNNMTDDVGAMVWQQAQNDSIFTTERVALTARQVIDRDVITAPPKPTDSRSQAFVARHYEVVDHVGSTDITAQLEALTPPELRQLLTESIESNIDIDIYNRVLDEEEEIRNGLFERLENV